MRNTRSKNQAGFSLVELMITMVIMLLLLGLISMVMGRSFSVRARETRKVDALVSAQAALNVMARELANGGFGIYQDSASGSASNGLIGGDCNANRIRFRSNLNNVSNYGVTQAIDEAGEDITYYFDAATDSIVRYDPFGTPQTSVVVNRISNVRFRYFNYTGASPTATEVFTPTTDTGRVTIEVEVALDPVSGQPDNQTVKFTTDVTLRNSKYMLSLY